MLRHILQHKAKSDPITWRCHEILRIEALTDGLFAFAAALLIISPEVPNTFDALVLNMKNTMAFFIGFLILFQVWYHQCIFFRRYALQDTYILVLNGILVFTVLFFMYPLKFLFVFLSNDAKMKNGDIPNLMEIYALCFSVIFLLLALMYKYAITEQHKLKLSKLELHETKTTMYRDLIYVAAGVLSFILAYFMRGKYAINAIWPYALIPLGLIPFHKHREKKLKQTIEYESGKNLPKSI